MVAGVALVPLAGQPWRADGALGRAGLRLLPDADALGPLLRRSARPRTARGAVFAAQFALSHACWLLTYPLAGRLGAGAGLSGCLLLAALGALGLVAVLRLWPARDPQVCPMPTLICQRTIRICASTGPNMPMLS